MLKYFIRRIAYMVVVFLIISAVIFFMYKLVPTDPVLNYMDLNASEDMDPELWQMMYEQTRIRLGLDKPLLVQYGAWLKNMVTGEYGYSMMYRRPVSMVISEPMKNTIMLNIINLVFVFIITIPLGIRSAVKRGSVFDNTVQVITILGYSLPTFIVAILAILIFAVFIPILPISGMATPAFEGTNFARMLDRAKYMILPMIVMTFTSLGGITRYIRSAMIEALSQDFVRTARAKGLKEKVVIYRHALRNAQIIVINIIVGWFLGIFGGSLMIERIFLWNGMGKLMIDSVYAQDYAIVFTVQMFYVLIGLIGHIIVDLLYALVDPRIRLS